MPQADDCLQVMLTEHRIVSSRAACLVVPVGRVVVEMLPESDRFGSLWLPGSVSGQMRPDVGIVLGCGPDVRLAPGQTVVVRGYDGQWIEGFDVGPYATKNQVRVYGKAALYQGELEAVPWSESIPLILITDGEDMSLVATGNNLVIRRDPIVTHDGVFEIPEIYQYRNGMAEVLSIGPSAVLDLEEGSVGVGDRICYDPRGELKFSFGDPDLAVIPDTAVNLVVARVEA